MSEVIFDPLEEFENKYKSLHAENANQYLNRLVQQSGVDIQQNRATVKQYDERKARLAKLRRKYNWRRFWRVLMILTIVLIPLVILKVTPHIQQLRAEIAVGDQKVAELLALAQRQMYPLNCLFTDRDALNLIEQTLPLMRFEDCFSAKQEANMTLNYNFSGNNDVEQSTLDVLAGHYNDNPFLFENRLVHRMGTETYHGYKTIYWTETYTDNEGHVRTRTRSQTLHATVVKPKPYYSTQVVLHYCAQGGPDLSFSRTATHLERKSDKEIERYVRQGEKKLKRMTDKAIKKGEDFTSMSNSQFEVLFNATDRTHEVQFRSLFTPLAQTNMVSLIRSQTGYGDDFAFIKSHRSNKIVSEHSQGRVINLQAGHYVSHSFDIIQQNFVGKNADFFKAVYFDFAPLLAIPMYQERPVHSLQPIPDIARQYSLQQCEALANAMDPGYVVHPETKTKAILKSQYIGARDGMDETRVTAYSYDIALRVDFVPTLGGDGRIHAVPVEWNEYLPLEAYQHFCVASAKTVPNQNAIANRNGLCMFSM